MIIVLSDGKNNIEKLKGAEIPDDLLDKDYLFEMGLDYGIVYNYDGIDSARVLDLDIDRDNLTEAIFFNNREEIKIIKNKDDIRAYYFSEEDFEDEDIISKKVLLYPRDKGKTYPYRMELKKYIAYEKDGQGYIAYTRPVKLCFEEGR